MVTIDVNNVETIQELIYLLETHPEITLVQSSRSIAKVTALTQKPAPDKGRVPNLHPQIWVSEDFDDVLPEEYWVNGTI